MRTFIYAVLLTLLAQPVWAYSVGNLVQYCTAWKDAGFKDVFTFDEDGVDALACASYLSAMSNVGSQSCNWTDVNDFLKWDANTNQLAQFVLNQAETKPEKWTYSGYTFLVVENASQFFPCKE